MSLLSFQRKDKKEKEKRHSEKQKARAMRDFKMLNSKIEKWMSVLTSVVSRENEHYFRDRWREILMTHRPFAFVTFLPGKMCVLRRIYACLVLRAQ